MYNMMYNMSSWAAGVRKQLKKSNFDLAAAAGTLDR